MLWFYMILQISLISTGDLIVYVSSEIPSLWPCNHIGRKDNEYLHELISHVSLEHLQNCFVITLDHEK